MDQLITFKRSGNATAVMLGPRFIGTIVRRSEMRSGRYRILHYPVTLAGKMLGPWHSRKEAVEELLRTNNIEVN